MQELLSSTQRVGLSQAPLPGFRTKPHRCRRTLLRVWRVRWFSVSASLTARGQTGYLSLAIVGPRSTCLVIRMSGRFPAKRRTLATPMSLSRMVALERLLRLLHTRLTHTQASNTCASMRISRHTHGPIARAHVGRKAGASTSSRTCSGCVCCEAPDLVEPFAF